MHNLVGTGGDESLLPAFMLKLAQADKRTTAHSVLAGLERELGQDMKLNVGILQAGTATNFKNCNFVPDYHFQLGRGVLPFSTCPLDSGDPASRIIIQGILEAINDLDSAA